MTMVTIGDDNDNDNDEEQDDMAIRKVNSLMTKRYSYPGRVLHGSWTRSDAVQIGTTQSISSQSDHYCPLLDVVRIQLGVSV